MKKYTFPLILLLVLLGCQSLENTPEPTPLDPSIGRTLKPDPFCGDGICDGPETAASCPLDCQPTPGVSPSDTAMAFPTQRATPTAIASAPPLYFFYAIHAHGSKEFLPYRDPGMTVVDPEVAENMILAIRGIAEVLEKYGAKGTFEFLPATIQGLATFQGENHIFAELLAHGHEIGVHAHQIKDLPIAVQALKTYCGISPQTTSGFIAQISNAGIDGAQTAMSEAIALPVSLGLNVGTTNLSPGGGKNTLSPVCNHEFGRSNDMWMDTGNLMYPWAPDYGRENICQHNPESELILIDHVSIEALILPDAMAPPDVLDHRHFKQLKVQFDAALRYMDVHPSDRVAVWGFVTHIIEYAIGSAGENPPDGAALEALNEFLSYVDTQQQKGLVIYATAAEIAERVSAQESP